MREEKDIDDVTKTDKTQARIEQDCADACRYLLKSMLAPRKKSAEDVFQEKMQAADPKRQVMINAIHQLKKEKSKGPYWKQKINVRHLGR